MTQSLIQEIFGTESNDPILGTPQNDLITGKTGNDLIVGNEGNDESFGEVGNDLFLDGTGNDTVRGGAGNDSAVSTAPDGEGDDLIDLGTGNDFAVGGGGADTFVLNRDSGVSLIADFAPDEDRFALGDGIAKDNLNFAQLNNDSPLNGSTLISDADTGELIAFVNSVPVEAVSNADFVSAENMLSEDNSSTGEGESNEPIQVESPPAQPGAIVGTPNPDILVGDDEANSIYAGDGNDFIDAGVGDDLVFGEDSFDLINGGTGNDFLDGGAGGDILDGGEGTDALLGEAGGDAINGGADADFLNGGEDADTLLGENGIDVLNGDAGNDVLLGGADGDTISGGQGDDLLWGEDGNDALFGDEGNDTFAFAPDKGADIIFDFELGQDAIALQSGISYDSLAIEYSAQGNYTTISDESGELITTLIGVEAEQLTESDFTTI